MKRDTLLRPKKLLAYVGGFEGPAYKIEYIGKNVITYDSRQERDGFFSGTDVKTHEPTDADWRSFRAHLDRAGIWNWKPAYDNWCVLDGTQWEVSIKYADKTVHSSGSNAYPDSFQDFLAAVRQLIGGEEFGCEDQDF